MCAWAAQQYANLNWRFSAADVIKQEFAHEFSAAHCMVLSSCSSSIDRQTHGRMMGRSAKLLCAVIGLEGGATSEGARYPPAFAESVPGESRDGRKARMDAYAACWSAMKTGFEVTL